MKRIIAILMACLFALSCTIAFAQGEKKLGIVCTTFPQYDWVRQILGDRVNDVDLTLLLDNGIDLHNYQPTAGDIIKIAQSDLFIYAGGESDGWVDDVLATAQNPSLKTVNLLASVEARRKKRSKVCRKKRMTTMSMITMKLNMTSMSGYLCAMRRR